MDNVLIFPLIKSLVVVAMLCALWSIDLILLTVANSESGVKGNIECVTEIN